MNLKKLLVLVFSFAVSSFAASAQFRDGTGYDELYDGETVSAMKNHVRTLSAAHLEGRRAGSEGEKTAAEYVSEIFKEYGIDVLTPAVGEEFGLKTADGDTLTSRNVIGFVEGYDKKLRDRFIVVGARLDNLGTMTMTVDGKQVERIYYGANGNACFCIKLQEVSFERIKNKNTEHAAKHIPGMLLTGHNVGQFHLIR